MQHRAKKDKAVSRIEVDVDAVLEAAGFAVDIKQPDNTVSPAQGAKKWGIGERAARNRLNAKVAAGTMERIVAPAIDRGGRLINKQFFRAVKK